MFMIEYNLSQSYEMAKQRQEMLIREIQASRRLQRQIAEATQEQRALRRFHVMYRVRHWMHRVAPRLARVML